MPARQEVPLLTPPSVREQREGGREGREVGEGALVVKAAETQRKKLLTDEMSSPHSLHGHFTGGRKRKSRASGASYQWRLAPQKEWRHPKVYKGERSPALAEACDSTPCCRHNSDVTHDNTLLKNVIFSAPSQRVPSDKRGDTDPPGPTPLGRHHWRVPQTQRPGSGLGRHGCIPQSFPMDTTQARCLHCGGTREGSRPLEAVKVSEAASRQTGAFGNKSLWCEVRGSQQVGTTFCRMQHFLWSTSAALRPQTENIQTTSSPEITKIV